MLMKPPTANHTYGARKPDPVTGLIDIADRDVAALELTGWVKARVGFKSGSGTPTKKPKRIALTDTPKETE